ncbi:MAG: hypothetical protein K2V38_27320, partial [Gemmataceae bacterium]|nr:hypothetical protein [Gemmataceae bacterium]
MHDCPIDADLTGFLNGALPEDLGAAVGGHIDGCAACQKRLDRLTSEISLAVVLPFASEASRTADTLVIGGRP